MAARTRLRRGYDMDVALAEIYPIVWRLVRVPATIRLANFHRVVQVLMGWDDYHLHVFSARSTRYGDAGMLEDSSVRNEYTATLRQAVTEAGLEPLVYEYDFGDGWMCRLTVVHELLGDDLPTRAVCLAGQRAGPPEDCGGVPGYEMLLDAMKAPKDEDDRERLKWLNELYPGYDPAALSVDDMNRKLEEMA